MAKNRAFSLYDIEEFLKEAGAERVNEKAIVGLEEELERTVKEILDRAEACANYAGRSKINGSDVRLGHEINMPRRSSTLRAKIQARRSNAVKMDGVVFTKSRQLLV